MTVRSAHGRFGDHPLGDMRRAAPAIADEAQEGVCARLVEVELGDLLRPALNPGGVGRALEVERRLRASPEGVAHRGQRRAGLVWRRDQVVRLSQHVESAGAVELISQGGFGYLLKDRVLDVSEFLEAAERVAKGGSALDPQVVASLVGGETDSLGVLTDREREVLSLMAEGLTNNGIARRLVLTERTVEGHVRHVLMKLDLPESEDANRRVLAVIAYLRAAKAQS
jgi:DNA-binding NarL/FixJ family response regulator